MKAKRLLNKLSNLSFTQLVLIIYAWWLFLKWDLLVSFFNYKYWQLTFERAHNEQAFCQQKPFEKDNALSKHNDPLPKILDIIKLSESVGRHHLRQMNCLRRCLCQRQLLATKQYYCQLHLGVKISVQTTDNRVHAHCWLSYQGKLINDSTDNIKQYTELKKITKSASFSNLFF